MNDYYEMQARNRKNVIQWCRENSWPKPGTLLVRIFIALVVQHRFSLICKEIDRAVEGIDLTHNLLKKAINDGNLVALVLVKNRINERKKELGALIRLLEKEAPVPVQQMKRNEITDMMIARAKDYPYEDLLDSYGVQVKRGRCRCPIHKGENPTSFEIKNNYASCHACGWTGDTIAFVREIEGCSFREAVEKLR